MDLFGKTLVLVNFGLSLMMAAIGGAALYYRVDWTDAQAAADGSAPAGELAARLERVNQLKGAIPPVDAMWGDARKSLIAQEDRRKLDEKWYVDELQRLRSDPKKQPILKVATIKDAQGGDTGRAVPDPANANLPKMEPVTDRYGQALTPLDVYNAALANVNKDLETKLGDIAKSAKEDEALTAKLVGTPASRGLIQRTKDEQVKQEGLAEEMKIVLLAQGQVRADSQLLLLRKKALQARIKELEKTGVAADRP
jgi:hypothetical protein